VTASQLTGGQCNIAFSYGMYVCYGESLPLPRGGFTLGVTFLSNQTDPSGQVMDPQQALTPQQYADMMEHEQNHAKQYQALGLGMIDYLTAEYAGRSFYPNANVGCSNIFEWAADLFKGGYPC